MLIKVFFFGEQSMFNVIFMAAVWHSGDDDDNSDESNNGNNNDEKITWKAFVDTAISIAHTSDALDKKMRI